MIDSPCVRKCIFDDDENYCTGCFRDLDDVWDWREKSDEERLEALNRAKLREENEKLENNK